jgi:hypothetical protein
VHHEDYEDIRLNRGLRTEIEKLKMRMRNLGSKQDLEDAIKEANSNGLFCKCGVPILSLEQHVEEGRHK